MRRLGAAAATVVLAAMLASCGSDTPSSDEPAADEPSPATSETPNASASADPTSPSENTSESASADPTSACSGKNGDGTGNELVSTTLTQTGDDLGVVFETKKAAPTKGTVLYSVDAWNPDGSVGYQLGVKFLNGEQIALFVFDWAETKQTDLDSEATVDGGTVTASFPMSDIESMGVPFKWSAILNVEGNDVDTCPAAGKDPIHPKQVAFPQ